MKAPKHLTGTARAFWEDVQREYDLCDAAGLALLTVAAMALQRAEEARQIIEAEGVTTATEHGVKAHPAVNIERDSRAGFLQSLRALNLDLEPLKDREGRPPIPHGASHAD